MIHMDEIWSIMQRNVARGRWVSVEEIRSIVEQNARLDTEDYDPEAPGSNIPKWRRNVRNVLVKQKNLGNIRWNKQLGSKSKYWF